MTTGEKHAMRLWLWSGIVLVIMMVGVGGATRLTGSGLSIVKWKLVTGVLPPLNTTQWDEAFEEYQRTPQYQQLNKHFAVDDFKKIYWWEYIHRLLGRLIGVVFVVPFAYFMIRKSVPLPLKRQLVAILCLGILQGLAGWIMVKSGLVDFPYVSHYRLALHLSLAVALIAMLLWTILQLSQMGTTKWNAPWLSLTGLVVLMIQIILGAFVAGLKAGYYYNSFPLMNGALIPDNLFTSLQNGVLIQFIHRWFAFITGGVIVLIWFHYRKRGDARLKRLAAALFIVTSIQIVSGIFTLIYRVPLVLGIFHQVIAVVLFAILVTITYYAGFARSFEIPQTQVSALRKSSS